MTDMATYGTFELLNCLRDDAYGVRVEAEKRMNATEKKIDRAIKALAAMRADYAKMEAVYVAAQNNMNRERDAA